MGIKKRKKELLCEFVDYICEICHKKFDIEELDIHRIRRGIDGGTYEDFKNLKVLCKNCHKIVHGREFNISRSY